MTLQTRPFAPAPLPPGGGNMGRLRYIEAPGDFEPDGRPSLYLAGATVDGPDWQWEAVGLLADAGFDGSVLNPRPSLNPATDPYRAWTPLGWQDRNIRRTGAVLYWNPLGHVRVHDRYTAGLLNQPGQLVVVGRDPADPVQQANRVLLAGVTPWLKVHDTLAATVAAVLDALDAAARG
ncbi:hypothetical protein ACIHEI_28440 [Kitasatospora sp. NPDC051984]|uniref:hypothetical protein n=1 Tax=Kitasatospora sp. NPDC051984 TaxID=3364059 RepID=UPI0037CAD6CC